MARLVTMKGPHSKAKTEGGFTYVVGFPKTGNTWLRLMLGHYAQAVFELSSLPLFDETPEWNGTKAGRFNLALRFTHHPLEWNQQAPGDLTYQLVIEPFLKGEVVLLSRYPLDALVSLYMQMRYKTQDSRTAVGLELFLRDPIVGLPKLLCFYDLWAKYSSHVERFRLLRYEDLLTAPETVLAGLISWLGWPVDETAVSDAVNFGSFENLRKLEKSSDVPRYATSGLPIFGPIDLAEKDSLHVRRGIAGGYRDYLSKEVATSMDETVAMGMDPIYGYQSPPARAGVE